MLRYGSFLMYLRFRDTNLCRLRLKPTLKYSPRWSLRSTSRLLRSSPARFSVNSRNERSEANRDNCPILMRRGRRLLSGQELFQTRNDWDALIRWEQYVFMKTRIFIGSTITCKLYSLEKKNFSFNSLHAKFPSHCIVLSADLYLESRSRITHLALALYHSFPRRLPIVKRLELRKLEHSGKSVSNTSLRNPFRARCVSYADRTHRIL